jgi:hypothetical protein
LRLRGYDVDLVAVLQLGDQRAHLAVDLAADRGVADVGVHRIRKVDRGGLARQRDQLALGGEAEHLIVEQLELGVLEKLLGVRALGKQLNGAPQPSVGTRFPRQHLRRRAVRVLVERVGGDAVFGDLVHAVGADLQLDALLAGSDHGRVQRAIVILLRGRNVILETPGNDRPSGVDDPQRAVALLGRADQDAETEDVRQLLEADRLALHLAPNRIGPFLPASDLGLDAAIGELAGELSLDLRDQVAIAARDLAEPPGHHLVGLGIELAEGEILELLAHLMHAHAAGERSIDVERLLRDAPAGLRLHHAECSHVVQAVSELDQQDAHVGGDRQQQLAQIFGLRRLLGDQVELLELGKPVDQVADVGAEQLVDLGPGGGGILDGVVQQRRRDRGIVDLEVGQDGRDFERMGEVKVARRPLLLPMRLHGIDVGAVQQSLVGVRIVAAHLLHQLVLPEKLRARFMFLFKFLALLTSGIRGRRRHLGMRDDTRLATCKSHRLVPLPGFGGAGAARRISRSRHRVARLKHRTGCRNANGPERSGPSCTGSR